MIPLWKEVDVYADRVELFRQSVPRPSNIGPWDWQLIWRKLWIDPEAYMDHVVLFGTTVTRPARIARSQWYDMWWS